MRRVAFDSALETLADLDAWLASVGIVPKRDRWHEAALMLRRAKEQREYIETGGSLVPIPNYVPALFEAMEVMEVMRAFSRDSSNLVLKDKLARALSGPVSPLKPEK